MGAMGKGREITLSPAPEVDYTTEAGTGSAAVPERRRRRITVKRVLLVLLLLFVAAAAVAYPQRSKFSAQAADFSRNIIGDENTARVESWYFRIDDHITQVKYRIFGGSTNPFATSPIRVDFVPRAPRTVVYYVGSSGKSAAPPLIADSLGPTPLRPPKTQALRDNPEAGEGVWTTVGLPRSSPTDMLMAKTFFRPDRSRPYAMVGVLLLDSRRISLHLVGGTGEPGGYRGVKGPGIIPSEAMSTLLAAWNGGFKGPHGNYGMYCDGKEYVPLRNGLASIAVMKDGSIKLGEYGRDFTRDENTVAVRQNAVLLVDKGEISKRVGEGNDTWGYVQVNSAEFITWRSAVGITKDGNLLFAAGNSLSAETLAKGLWAAGAYMAMQLDINSPYVLLSTFTQQPDGTLKADRFMDNMPDSPSRFLKTQERDFMYVTLDETHYRY
jgi:hypothetical protein